MNRKEMLSFAREKKNEFETSLVALERSREHIARCYTDAAKEEIRVAEREGRRYYELLSFAIDRLEDEVIS